MVLPNLFELAFVFSQDGAEQVSTNLGVGASEQGPAQQNTERNYAIRSDQDIHHIKSDALYWYGIPTVKPDIAQPGFI